FAAIAVWHNNGDTFKQLGFSIDTYTSDTGGFIVTTGMVNNHSGAHQLMHILAGPNSSNILAATNSVGWNRQIEQNHRYPQLAFVRSALGMIADVISKSPDQFAQAQRARILHIINRPNRLRDSHRQAADASSA